MSAPYQPMTEFAGNARGRAELWRTLMGILVAAFVAILVFAVLAVSLDWALGRAWMRAQIYAMTFRGTPLSTVALLYSFVPLVVGLTLMLHLVMRRGLGSLIGPLRPAVYAFMRVGAGLLLVWTGLDLIAILSGGARPYLSLQQLAPWLPLALGGILLQSATEELIFRGYLQQQLAARFAARWVWMGVPALLFGAIHYDGMRALDHNLMVMGWAMLFGLICADLTARTGNLGAALGMHFANNVLAILFVGTEGPLGGLALYFVALNPFDTSQVLLFLGAQTLHLLVGWLLARLILRV